MASPYHAELGDAVADLSRQHLKVERRRHVDNVAVLLLEHVRQHGSRTRERSTRIDAVDQVVSVGTTTHA